MKYKIEVQETLARIVEVEADSPADACAIVEEMVDNEEIVLDYSDFIDRDIHPFEP